MQASPTIDAGIAAMTPEAAGDFLRAYKKSTLRQVRYLVETCRRAERVDQRLATILEDIGQEFIGLSYPINAAAYAQEAARKAQKKPSKLAAGRTESEARRNSHHAPA